MGVKSYILCVGRVSGVVDQFGRIKKEPDGRWILSPRQMG